MANTSVGECYPFGGRGGMTAPASVPVMITNLTMPNLSRTSPSRRSRGYPVLLLAIALITAGCTSTGSAGSAGWIDTSRPSEVDGHPPVQDIAWEDCTAAVEQILGEPFPLPVRFDCARLEVPADYEDPEAGLLELEVLRAVSTAADRDRIGSLVVNPGGPGVSGLEAALTVALLSPEELLSGFDIVGFDPRGVGRSSPIECVDDRFKDELVGADPTPTSEPEIAAAIERFTQLVTACQDTHGERLANFNTGYTARDMDRLREALGDEQLTYLGYSYGTTLGSTYAELFPERVRAMVLDGAVDPDLGPVEFVQGQAAGFEQAFDTFAQACIAIGPACPIGPDPRQFVTELLAAAERNPIPQASGDPRQGTAGFVFNGVVAALYAEETWPILAEALAAAAAGDATGIIALADAISGRTPEGYTNQLEANTTINCNDFGVQISEREIRAYVEEWSTTYPLFGAFGAVSLSTCAAWDSDQNPLPERDAEGADPVLVIGTVGDPATPYDGSRAMAEQLDSGVLLTWEGQGHTAFPKTECITGAVVGYLLDLAVPAEGTTCPA